MTAGVPLVVDPAGLRVVAVGAGRVAAAKILPLVDAGAEVVVVAPEAGATLREAAAAGRVQWRARAYRDGDLDGALLAVAATDRPEVNAEVAADAAARATLCVRVDGGGSAAFAAALRRGPLMIAVSTCGAAPALAARLRAELDSRYGEEYGTLAALLGELRGSPQVRAALDGLDDDARRARWRSLLDTDILTLIRTGRTDLAKEVALACLSSSSG